MTAQLEMTFAASTSRDIDRLIPLARALARKAGADGVTVADIREEAVRRGYLTGAEKGKRLAFLGNLMRAAQLTPTSDYRRSAIEQSHGNLHRVWVLV